MTSPTASTFGTAATIGKREVQEDSIGWSRDRYDLKGELPMLSIIADGMGGHAAGEVASKIAVDGFLDAYRRKTPGDATVLIDALDWANGQIAGHVAAHPETDGMGCTLVAVEVNADSTAYRWISVGDSLLLSVKPSGIERLNADHSYREERERLLAAGESLDGAPAANVLRSALMGFDVPLIDNQTEWRAFVPGETLILATDGLETLNPDRVLDIARAHDGASAIADALVASVEASGKPRQDNTSVAVIRPSALHSRTLAEPTQPPAPIPDDAESKEPTTTPAAIASAAEEARTLPPAPRPLPSPAPSATPGAAAKGNASLPAPGGKRTAPVTIVLLVLIGVAIGLLGGWFALTKFTGQSPIAPKPSAEADAPPANAAPSTTNKTPTETPAMPTAASSPPPPPPSADPASSVTATEAGRPGMRLGPPKPTPQPKDPQPTETP